MLVELSLKQPSHFLDYCGGGDDMIMQIKNVDPISYNLCFIVHILQGGVGGALEPSLMQSCHFLDY